MFLRTAAPRGLVFAASALRVAQSARVPEAAGRKAPDLPDTWDSPVE